MHSYYVRHIPQHIFTDVHTQLPCVDNKPFSVAASVCIEPVALAVVAILTVANIISNLKYVVDLPVTWNILYIIRTR